MLTKGAGSMVPRAACTATRLPPARRPLQEAVDHCKQDGIKCMGQLVAGSRVSAGPWWLRSMAASLRQTETDCWCVPPAAHVAHTCPAGLLADCPSDFLYCSSGVRFFPSGRDYLGPNIYMLKGIPDQPTPDNFPAVPIELHLTNW